MPLVKVLKVFYHFNTSLFLPQLQYNKFLQVQSSPMYIFKGKGTHHSKKMSCKPGGTWIQKQHFLFLKFDGMILEERMWRMIVSTKEPVYCLEEEGNQCSVEQKGGNS